MDEILSRNELTTLILIVVPIVMRLTKNLIPTWLVPIAATVLGAVGKAVGDEAIGLTTSVSGIIGTGLATIGTREVADQIIKRVKAGRAA